MAVCHAIRVQVERRVGMSPWFVVAGYVVIGLLVMLIADVIEGIENVKGMIRMAILMLWPLFLTIPLIWLLANGYKALVKWIRKVLRIH